MTGAAPAQDARGEGRGRWVALAVCSSALFMSLLDVSVTNVALPSIGEATGAGPAQLQWIVSGYTLTFGMVPVLAGKLGDEHGRRRMFQIGVAGFALASLVAGLSPSDTLLIAARLVQGMFAGLINPQVSGLIQQMFRGAERGRAFGVLGTVVGLGTALGPLVGGLLIAVGGQEYGWRLVFFVNVPIAAAVILLARRHLPSTPRTDRHRLDVPGALLLGLAVFCVLISTVEYDQVKDLRIFLLLLPGLLLLAVFLRRERRLTDTRRDPLVDFRLFREPSYTAGVLFALAFFPAFAGIPLVLAIFYQDGLGYTALQSALGVTALAVGNAVAAPIAGRVVTRIGRPLLVGAGVVFAVGAIGLVLVTRSLPDGNVALALAGPLFLMGLGAGGMLTPNQTLTLARVDPVVGSTAGGVLQTSQRIGLAVGQAVVGAVFFAGIGRGERTDYGDAAAAAVGIALLFVLAAIVIGVVDLVRHRPRPARDRAA